MNRRYLIALALFVAAALAACAGGGVTEAPPVFVTSPQGNRVEALAMTTPRANAAAIRLRDGRVLICGGTATGRSRRRAVERRAVRSRRAHLHADRLDDGPASGANDHDAPRRTRAADGRRPERRLPLRALECGDLRSGRRHFQRDRLDVGGARRVVPRRCCATGACWSPAAATTASTRWTRPRFTTLRAVLSVAPAICISRASRTSRRCSVPARF